MSVQTSLIVKLWGVRGSVPTPLSSDDIRIKQVELLKRLYADGGSDKLFGNPPDQARIDQWLQSLSPAITGTCGGNTTCFEVRGLNSPLIMIDAGTGARAMGQYLLKRLFSKQPLNPLNTVKASERDIHLFFSHYHWDHLQGFPFFGPAFTYGASKINFIFYGRRDAKQRLSEVLGGQQECPNFPVAWEDMPCNKTFVEMGRLDPHPMQIGDVTVNYQELNHPDSVFGYAFTCNGKRFVYATDTEHRDMPDPRLMKLAQNADCLYYDSQYTPSEYRGDQGSLTG
ncbi:MAG TPA: MBL fold metallo-hydrolase, partial [Candidatus Ozemobacteraceae bacterium]|nr:MBL fold metallo-hydrolase [Candidatus Ozemobacteraceae bacterium]